MTLRRFAKLVAVAVLAASIGSIHLSSQDQSADRHQTHYRVFTGNGAVFDLIQQTKLQDITDGTSNTVMVVESAEGVTWSKPSRVSRTSSWPKTAKPALSPSAAGLASR